MKLDAKPKFIYKDEQPHQEGRFAVIDIGSSTLRLVVYDEGLYPHLFLNHKVRVRFAENKGTGDFYLEEKHMERALSAIEWFLWVCRESSVRTVVATATSAVREAKNGADFVNLIKDKTGLHVEVISGESEARLSAEGAVKSLPDAEGVVMDLGGGSLDICQTETHKDFASLPLGVLSLKKLSDGDPAKAVEILKESLKNVDWLSGQGSMDDLVALGSGMRSIASLHMNETNYPMRILHAYGIGKDEAISYCDKFIRGEISEKSSHIAKGYEDVIPFRAAALKAMLEVGEFKRVRFASFGIREGIFFSQIEKGGVGDDPLLSFACDIAERDGRGVHYGIQLSNWAHQFLPSIDARILQAACLFADVAWREQYTYRAQTAFEIVHGSPFVACSHKDRAMISLIVFFAHEDEVSESVLSRISGLLSADEILQAKQAGLLIHLASFLDPGARGLLSGFNLIKNADDVFEIEGPEVFMNMASESVSKRLEILNKALA